MHNCKGNAISQGNLHISMAICLNCISIASISALVLHLHIHIGISAPIMGLTFSIKGFAQ